MTLYLLFLFFKQWRDAGTIGSDGDNHSNVDRLVLVVVSSQTDVGGVERVVLGAHEPGEFGGLRRVNKRLLLIIVMHHVLLN